VETNWFTASNYICDKMFLMENTLPAFLNDQMAVHSWKQADLARFSGLNRAVINKIISGSTKPTPETCQALAKGLDLPLEFVYRAAGILPDAPKEDPDIKMITYLAEKLPTTDYRQQAIKFMRTILEIAEDRGKYDTDQKRASKPKSN
jgi:transcriptional regulator with XRE-family HTH domain